MADIRKINLRDANAERIAIAKQILENAIASNPETVIVMCYKDGMVSLMMSETVDTTQLIGALETAKMELWLTTLEDSE